MYKCSLERVTVPCNLEGVTCVVQHVQMEFRGSLEGVLYHVVSY